MRISAYTLLFVLLLSLVGCASKPKDEFADEQLSTQPWNRPASWEGQGQLGGMIQQ